jgi:5'-nucleotidase
MSEPAHPKALGRILVTNDDGIAAPGLKVLTDIAHALAEEVWVVAPEHDRSGAGQSITLSHPLRVYRHGERRFALSGNPADCVLFALAEWFGETPPDLVLSGVNCGANISDSVQYSGTVGAVLTAEHMGVPAMALSQAFLNREGINWSPVATWGEPIVRKLWSARTESHCCWNINFPACEADEITGVCWAYQSTGSIQSTQLLAGQDGRNLPYWWLGFERSSRHIVDPLADVTVLRDRAIAVTPLRSEQRLPGGLDRYSLEQLQ